VSDQSGTTVVVVGGGVSGLSAAWELTTSAPPGTRIVVLEATERLGGLLRSATVGGRLIDVGADAFLARRPEAIELCAELEISGELVAPATSNASVWARGALRRLPDGLVLGVPTRIGALAGSGIVSPVGAARAALDLFTPARRESASPAPDRSVGEIVTKRLGKKVCDLVTGPLVGGISAGRVDELSAESVFPALIEARRRGGSLLRALRKSSGPPAGTPAATSTAGANGEAPVFLAPRAGMASLPDVLASALRARGVEVLTSQAVEGLELDSGKGWSITTTTHTVDADGVVLAVPSGIAGKLLAEIDEGLAELLAGVKWSSVVLVTLQLDSESLIRPLEGSGFLVPAVGQGLVTACTFLSTKWPHLAREGEALVRASAGRYGNERATALGDEELVAEVLGELERMLGHVGRMDAFGGIAGFGSLGQPREVVVTRYPDSFPQYLVGHLDRVAAMEAAAASLPGLALAGASYRGIGVPACVASGRKAARQVAASIGLKAGPGRQSPGSQSPGRQSPGSQSPGSQSPGSQSPGSQGGAEGSAGEA
jgi:protoporphyrinogen/coproporphyrinogen III oxidase